MASNIRPSPYWPNQRPRAARVAAYAGSCALLLTGSDARTETLKESNDVVFRGKARIEVKRAATCSGGKHNGEPLHIWRLDYSVENESRDRLESVTAQVRITSPQPPCKEWSALPNGYNALGISKPLLWGDSVHVLQGSDIAPDKRVDDAVFVLVFHDQEPKFGDPSLGSRFPSPVCAEPAPLLCKQSGKLRLDPTLLMISRRYAWDSTDTADRTSQVGFDPFKHGTTKFDLRLAGIDFAYVWTDKLRIGLTGSFGISDYAHTRMPDGMATNGMETVDSIEANQEPAEETAVVTVLSAAAFFQVANLYRIELGLMHAISGHDDLLGAEDDKTAWFVGVAFPLTSDEIRSLVARLW